MPSPQDYHPGIKFLLIKAVIFVTFWQGVVLAVLLRTGTLDGHDDAEYIQNLLVALEMGGAAMLMLAAFPWVSTGAHTHRSIRYCLAAFPWVSTGHISFYVRCFLSTGPNVSVYRRGKLRICWWR